MKINFLVIKNRAKYFFNQYLKDVLDYIRLKGGRKFNPHREDYLLWDDWMY